MLFKLRIAMGLALTMSLITAVTVFAKGGYSFITIQGGALKEAIRLSERDLTTDFFAFADFYLNKTETPANPGVGYEVTRYYMNGGAESAFDQLHYYPETGFVYYDGLVNGSSEYDDHWYIANPDMKILFERVLYTQIRLIELGNPEAAQALVPPVKSVQELNQQEPNAFAVQHETVFLTVLIAGFAIVAAMALIRSRKLSTH
jgi:hypothetical protein